MHLAQTEQCGYESNRVAIVCVCVGGVLGEQLQDLETQEAAPEVPHTLGPTLLGGDPQCLGSLRAL